MLEVAAERTVRSTMRKQGDRAKMQAASGRRPSALQGGAISSRSPVQRQQDAGNEADDMGDEDATNRPAGESLKINLGSTLALQNRALVGPVARHS